MADPDPLPAPPAGDLDFGPVPVAGRRDGWTPDRQRGFVAALARCGLVGAAAKAVGMTARTAYRLRDRPGAEGFAAAWDRAVGEGLDRARLDAFERAVAGEDVPVFRRGLQVGVRRRHNDRLLIAALRVIERDPARAQVNGSSHSAGDVARPLRLSDALAALDDAPPAP